MTSMRRLLVLVAACSLALAAVSTAGSSGRALTPAAYTKQATALCVKANKRIAALPKSTSTKPAAIAKSLDKALGALSPLLADFRKLSPPPAKKALHTSTVEGLTDGLALGRQISKLIAKGSDLQKAIATVQTPFLQALSAIQNGFKGLGLKPCESVLGSALGGA